MLFNTMINLVFILRIISFLLITTTMIGCAQFYDTPIPVKVDYQLINSANHEQIFTD